MTTYYDYTARPTPTDEEIDAAVAALVAGAPVALDTLNELAAALADDANFATTVTNALAGKIAKADFGPNTILAATVDDTPVALTVGEDRLVGRIAGGGIDDLTEAQVKTLLGVDEVVIYQAGVFTGSLADGTFPGRARAYQTAILGGAAGNHTVAGIATADDLISVIEFETITGIPTDRTAEFTITAANTINNAGGTSTALDVLLVAYMKPEGTTLGGLPFPDGSTSKGSMPMFAPLEWPSVDINILGLAASFGSGTVRFSTADTSDAVDIEVAAAYIGLLNFPTGPSWSPGAGAWADQQFAQLALQRLGGHANDDLAEPFCGLSIALTPGA